MKSQSQREREREVYEKNDNNEHILIHDLSLIKMPIQSQNIN